MSWFGSPPDKTEEHYRDFWGRRVHKIHYADTGKTVTKVTRDRFFGGTETNTYIQRGRKRIK